MSSQQIGMPENANVSIADLPTDEFERRLHKIGRLMLRPEPVKIQQPLQPFLEDDFQDAEVITAGFDFSVPELRVIDAVERLFGARRWKSLNLLCDVDTFAQACGLKKVATEKYPSPRYSHREIDAILKAAEDISNRRGILFFKSGDGKRLSATTARLWETVWVWADLTPEEEVKISAQDFDEYVRRKIKKIGFRLDPIWQHAATVGANGKLYYHRPASLRERLRIAGYSRRTRPVELFISWLLQTGEPVMHGYTRFGNRPEITISLEELATICGLASLLHTFHRKRVIATLQKAANLAHLAGLLSDPSHAFNSETQSFLFSLVGGTHWHELREWQQHRDRKKPANAAPEQAYLPSKEQEKSEAAVDPEIARFVQELQETANRLCQRYSEGKLFARELESQIAGWSADRESFAQQKDVDPGRRRAICAAFDSAINTLRTARRGAKLPKLSKISRPPKGEKTVATDEPVVTPKPDPNAAACWKQILEEITPALPENRKEWLKNAVPVKLEDGKIVLWFPLAPVFDLMMCQSALAPAEGRVFWTDGDGPLHPLYSRAELGQPAVAGF